MYGETGSGYEILKYGFKEKSLILPKAFFFVKRLILSSCKNLQHSRVFSVRINCNNMNFSFAKFHAKSQFQPEVSNMLKTTESLFTLLILLAFSTKLQ